MKITILDGYAANPGDLSWEEWKELGCELCVYDRTSPSELIERAKDSEILITNKVVISREVMSQLPLLRYVGVTATGYNIVDVEAAKERGVIVTNIPAYSTDSVAQMVFAHILNITNNVAAHAQSVNRGEWQGADDFCYWLTEQQELSGRTIGIVGLGNTGQKTARIALAMGMKVMAYTSKTLAAVREMLGSDDVLVAKDINTLFSSTDILSLHCPLTPDTKHIVNEQTLALMKPTAILINTGRGPLVDEDALAKALKDRRILAAGIDVLTEEAPRSGSPLIGLDNCFITPHIAWATTAARKRLLDIAIANVKAFLTGKAQNVVS